MATSTKIAKTRDLELSEKLGANIMMHKGSVLSHFIFSALVDVATEFVIEVVLSESLYADDLVLMSETID